MPLTTTYVGTDLNAVVDHAQMHNDVNTAVNALVSGHAVKESLFATIKLRSSSTTTKTLTFASHPFTTGDTVTVAAVGGSGYNGTFAITSTTSTTIVYTGGASSTEGATQDIGNVSLDPKTLTARSIARFKGAGVQVADNSGSSSTDITIPGTAPAPAVSGYLGPFSAGYYASSFTDYQTMKLCRITVPEGVTTFDLARIEANATIAGTIRLGVYTDDGANKRPYTLIADWGTVTTAAVGFPFVYGLTISWSPIPGTYWLAVASQTGGAGTQPISEGLALPSDHLAGGTFPIVKVQQHGSPVSGALPATFSASGATNADRWPLVQLRRSV